MSSSGIATAAPQGELDFFGLIEVLWKARLTISIITVLCVGIAVTLALTAEPIFRAKAIITEARESSMGGGASLASQFGGLASLAGINIGGDGAGREAKAILQSRHLIEEFIRAKQLAPVLFPGRTPTPSLWRCVDKFQNSVLTVHEEKITGLTTVAMDWTDPVIAARWANDFVAMANEMMRDRALKGATRNVAYLNEQLAKTSVVEVRRAMFNLIESETKTLMLASARSEYAFTTIDPAVPPEIRESPKRTIMVALGGIAGLLIGSVVAFSRHGAAVYRRRRLVAA